MFSEEKKHSRRDLLITAVGIGVGSLPASAAADGNPESAGSKAASPIVPTRPFGNSGQNVSALALGGFFDARNNKALLKQAMGMGVTYWEAVSVFPGGQEGYGAYFKNNPNDRKKVFLLAKTHSSEPELMTRELDETLQAMNTDYIDFFILHAIDRIVVLDSKIRKWADKAKAANKIRFFGFSTHKNMEQCMLGASELGWIDGIVTVYNYRLMENHAMQKAVDACAKAGIALTAINSQGLTTIPVATISKQSDTICALEQALGRKGFTIEQARLMAIWQNPHITGICALMPNITILMSNIAACLDSTSLSSDDLRLLKQYAHETASQYCASCGHICEPTVAGMVPISDIMKCLMHARSYGERALAGALYQRLPEITRKRVVDSDYSLAEQMCPQNMAIGKLMKEAEEELG